MRKDKYKVKEKAQRDIPDRGQREIKLERINMKRWFIYFIMASDRPNKTIFNDDLVVTNDNVK